MALRADFLNAWILSWMPWRSSATGTVGQSGLRRAKDLVKVQNSGRKHGVEVYAAPSVCMQKIQETGHCAHLQTGASK